MDFNTFANQNNDKEINQAKVDDVEKVIEHYSHLSGNDMMQELFKEVRKERLNGSFDISSLKTFYRNIAPYLGNNERTKMRNIIEALENN